MVCTAQAARLRLSSGGLQGAEKVRIRQSDRREQPVEQDAEEDGNVPGRRDAGWQWRGRAQINLVFLSLIRTFELRS